MTTELQVHYKPSAWAIEYKTDGAAGMDVCASESASIEPGEYRLVRTGVVAKAPVGHYLALIGRSSLIKRGLMLANGVGVVDSDYCGPDDEIGLLLLNVGKATAHVVSGDRLAQLVVTPFTRVACVAYDPSAEVSRGGFGSTGAR